MEKKSKTITKELKSISRQLSLLTKNINFLVGILLKDDLVKEEETEGQLSLEKSIPQSAFEKKELFYV